MPYNRRNFAQSLLLTTSLLTACAGRSIDAQLPATSTLPDMPAGEVAQLTAEAAQPVDDAQASTLTIFTAWLLNSNGETAVFLGDGSSPVNVQSVDVVQIGGAEYVRIVTSGIPSYTQILDEAMLTALTTRPRAEEDFRTGAPLAELGQTITFGQDIGFVGINCATGQGGGYWPPGGDCPVDQERTVVLPVEPQPATQVCYGSTDTIGLWVNGTAIFSWGGVQSYQDDAEWHLIEPVVGSLDLDMCSGQAINGNYHHRVYSACLADALDDDGTGHSPIYGFAADGYPIYGPWEADQTLATSCWKTRDYDTGDSDTGCGEMGERDCLLVDPYDISQGTTSADEVGPHTDEIVVSLSGNEFVAVSGTFFQDYYYDSTCSTEGDAALDAHNGHSDDVRGYHYHVTVVERANGTLAPVFPFTFGPEFYGELRQGALSACVPDATALAPVSPAPLPIEAQPDPAAEDNGNANQGNTARDNDNDRGGGGNNGGGNPPPPGGGGPGGGNPPPRGGPGPGAP